MNLVYFAILSNGTLSLHGLTDEEMNASHHFSSAEYQAFKKKARELEGAWLEFLQNQEALFKDIEWVRIRLSTIYSAGEE